MFRTIFYTVSVVLFVFVSIGVSSCKKTSEPYDDPCSGVQCQNGAICIDGNCSCPSGFEGVHCEQSWLKRYLGQWEVEQEIAISDDPLRRGLKTKYNMTIEKNGSSNTSLLFDGFLNNYNNVLCIVGLDAKGASANSSTFAFKNNFAIEGTKIIVLEGEGTINSLGTIINGTLKTIEPKDTSAVNETVSFSARYIQ